MGCPPLKGRVLELQSWEGFGDFNAPLLSAGLTHYNQGRLSLFCWLTLVSPPPRKLLPPLSLKPCLAPTLADGGAQRLSLAQCC